MEVFLALFIIGDLHLSESVDKPMDIFGGAWHNYTEKLISQWQNTVKPDDTVILAGDISWGMSLFDSLADFKLLDRLNGTKLILKGNHDYWWDTVTKMTKFLNENGVHSVKFIYNNSYTVDGIAVCGTRGWTPETSDSKDSDRKIIAREAGRLERSFQSAPDDIEKIAVFHYPPLYDNYTSQPFIELMQKYGVKRCFYGHLHAASIKNAKKGEFFGINFYLVSADSIDFLPVKI